jgi:ribosomal protein S18 acetylase RimI-like enzyme
MAVVKAGWEDVARKRTMLTWKRVGLKDVPLLADLNARLIEDEKARTSRDVAFLRARMRRWLRGPYRGVLFYAGAEPVAYALYRRIRTGVHLRQFYVDRLFRRKGYGRQAMRTLLHDVFPKGGVLTLDVLIHNKRGYAFWKEMGFKGQALIMQRRLL